MIRGIDDPSNKERIAVVAVGYNRKKALERMLKSLNDAKYNNNDEVPLVISIDASGDQELYEFVRSFTWTHGVKYVNIQEQRLGLKQHILQCGDLTKYFKAIALFEDDLWVSPYYYEYLTRVVDHYGDDEKICEISLYRNERMGNSGFYFDALHDGSDCFLWQDVSTWGECWTEKMWIGFRNWLVVHDDDFINGLDIPETVKKWSRAWSKYYIAYEVDTKKYVLFPHESLTTNFNDAGGEHGGGSNIVQVNVLHGHRQYTFYDTDKMVHYDIYTNNEDLYNWLPEYADKLCLDLYGSRRTYSKSVRYVLSMKKLPYKIIKEWGLKMRPIELNILYNIPGDGIRLYDINFSQKALKGYCNEVVPYMLRGFNPRLLFCYLIKSYTHAIIRKIHKFAKKLFSSVS